jgi:hypothetical protein
VPVDLAADALVEGLHLVGQEVAEDLEPRLYFPRCNVTVPDGDILDALRHLGRLVGNIVSMVAVMGLNRSLVVRHGGDGLVHISRLKLKK